MILFLKILLIWLLLGFIALIWGWRMLHNPENDEKVEATLNEMSEDVGISKEDCLVLFYFVLLTLGIIVIPFVLIRKVLNLKRGE